MQKDNCKNGKRNKKEYVSQIGNTLKDRGLFSINKEKKEEERRKERKKLGSPPTHTWFW